MSRIDPIFSLAQRHPRENSTTSQSWLRVYEESSGGGTPANNPFQSTLMWRITDTKNWLELARSYITFPVRLTNTLALAAPPAPNVVAGDNAALINGFEKVFRRTVLRADGTPIHTHPNYAREYKNIMNVLDQNVDFDRCFGTLMGYVAEVNSLHTAAPTTTVYDLTGQSNQYRSSLTDNGRVALFAVPLHRLFPILNYMDTVVSKTQWEIELELYPQNEICTRTTIADGLKMEWAGAPVLHVDRREPSLEVAASLMEQLNNKFSINGYEYLDYITHKRQYPGASDNIDFHVQTNVSRPTRVYIAFQHVSRLNNQDENKTIYDKCGVNRLSLMMDGTPAPTIPYELNWGSEPTKDVKGDRMRAYMDILASRGLNVANTSSPLVHGSLSKYDWENAYTIYCIDLNNQADSAFSGSSELTCHVERSNDAADFNIFVTVEHIKLLNLTLSQTEASWSVA